MTWIDDFLGRVNRKCANCGQLLRDEATGIRTVKGVKVCSEWCEQYYHEHGPEE